MEQHSCHAPKKVKTLLSREDKAKLRVANA
jgi:hypothetical protein